MAIALEMTAGSTYPFRLAVTNELTEAVENLNDWEEIWCTAKESVIDEDDDAVFQLTLTGGEITLIDGLNGLIEITVPDTAFPDDWATHSLYLDVKGRDGFGAHWALEAGQLTVLAGITRAV